MNLKKITAQYAVAISMGFLSVGFLLGPISSAHAVPTNGIAMHGEPALSAGDPLPYSSPEARAGGTFRRGVVGGFSNLNPFNTAGRVGFLVRGLVYEPLMARSYDEPFSIYGLLAETIETAPDRSWVEFKLREQAKFSDGKPVTVDDVLFTFNLLRERGKPGHRSTYSKVKRAYVSGERKVRFEFFDGNDKELALVMGLMSIMPRHAIDLKNFEFASLQPPVGSGPYRVTSFKPDARIVFEKRSDWWGKDLDINSGMHNFASVVIDYYKDSNSMFEAFKIGDIDIMAESQPQAWEDKFDFPAVRDGRVTKLEVDYGLPRGMNGFVFNSRRSPFDNLEVRKALTSALDFDWINKSLFGNGYDRAVSFFVGSDLASVGKLPSDQELLILRPYLREIDAKVLVGDSLFTSEREISSRERLRNTLRLLNSAGFKRKGDVLVDEKTGKALSFEIMVRNGEQKKMATTYSEQLRRYGITANVVVVDGGQYQERRKSFNFDVIINRWIVSLSPGTEQYLYFGSQSADTQGSRNYFGAKNPAIDQIIEKIVAADTRVKLVDAVRALDRVLLSGFYVAPLTAQRKLFVAHNSSIKVPKHSSLFGYVTEAWWHEAQE